MESKKKIKFLFVSSLISAICLCTVVFIGQHANDISPLKGEQQHYDLILNSDNAPDFTLSPTINTIKYTDFQYSNVGESPTGHVKLNSLGLLTNTTPITGLSTIIVSFTLDAGVSLTLYSGTYALPIDNPTELTSGITFSLPSDVTYFVLQAKGGEVDIHNVGLEYTCSGSFGEPDLPKVYVQTNLLANGKRDTISSRTVYTTTSLSLKDDINPINSVGITKPLSGGMKIRGNSTSDMPKKPYRIKLDKKQSFFGLTAAKSWVLLAEYMDGSALHNFSAYTYAGQLTNLSFTPHPNFVELYLNGEYNGIYVFAENPDENVGRINVQQTITAAFTPPDFNFEIELDESALSDPTSVLGETYFAFSRPTIRTQYYSVNYPGITDCVSKDQYMSLFSYIQTYVGEIWDLFEGTDLAALSARVDVPSLIDYMLNDCVFGESDHFAKSFKMYYTVADGKLHFGPVWDYDSCSFSLAYEGHPVESPFDECYSNPYSRTVIYNPFFSRFSDNFSGYSKIKQRYNELGKTVFADVVVKEKQALTTITSSLIANANLWFSGDLSMVFENLKFTNEYILQRKAFLDYKFA